MAFQSRKQHFLSQITTTNRQFVSNQTAAAPASFNNLGTANPFATTVENPWAGLNHMLLGSDNMVIQPTPNAQSGPANMLPNGQRKRSSTDSTTNQRGSDHNICFPIPDYAPQNLKDEMIQLRETDHLLFQESKKIKIQFAEKQNQAVQHLVKRASTPMLNNLKEKDAEILNLVNLNRALQENVKNLFDDNQKWRKLATTWELMALSWHNYLGVTLAEVWRQQGLVPPTVPVPAPREEEEEEHDVNVSEKNTQAKAQVVAVKDGGETERGEGSGEKRMCMRCGKMRRCVLALPCWHLCFCTVCGSRESSRQGRCPVCMNTMIATAPVSPIPNE